MALKLGLVSLHLGTTVVNSGYRSWWKSSGRTNPREPHWRSSRKTYVSKLTQRYFCQMRNERVIMVMVNSEFGNVPKSAKMGKNLP